MPKLSSFDRTNCSSTTVVCVGSETIIMIPFVQSNWLSQFQSIFAPQFPFLPEEYSPKRSWSQELAHWRTLPDGDKVIIINDIIFHDSPPLIYWSHGLIYYFISSRWNPLKMSLSALWWALDEAIDDEESHEWQDVCPDKNRARAELLLDERAHFRLRRMVRCVGGASKISGAISL